MYIARAVLIVSFTVLFVGCSTLNNVSKSTKPKSETLSAERVTVLFSNHTVESYNPRRKVTSFTYYHPDGQLLQERFWETRSGQWKVLADGQICLTFTETTCRFIEANLDKYSKYRIEDDTSKQTTAYYRRFIKGNVLDRN